MARIISRVLGRGNHSGGERSSPLFRHVVVVGVGRPCERIPRRAVSKRELSWWTQVLLKPSLQGGAHRPL